LFVLFSFFVCSFTLSHFYFSPDADVLQDHNPHRNRALFLQNMRSLFSPARMFLFFYEKNNFFSKNA